MKQLVLAALFLPFAACTSSTETEVNRTITAKGDTIETVSTTTSERGLDSATFGKAGEKLENTGEKIEENLKEGAGAVKEEYKETKQELKERRNNPDTIVVKKNK